MMATLHLASALGKARAVSQLPSSSCVMDVRSGQRHRDIKKTVYTRACMHGFDAGRCRWVAQRTLCSYGR